MVATETYTIEDPDGNTETVELPAGLPDMFTEQGEDSIAVVCDLIIQSFAQQSHAVSISSIPTSVAAITR